MSIVIDIAQAFDLARELGIDVESEETSVNNAALRLGKKIAHALAVVVSPDSTGVATLASAGVCVVFNAREPGQECPRCLQKLDPEGEL